MAKITKNPRTDKSVRKIAYMRKIAGYFGITEDKPFCGVFYFEQAESITPSASTSGHLSAK